MVGVFIDKWRMLARRTLCLLVVALLLLPAIGSAAPSKSVGLKCPTGTRRSARKMPRAHADRYAGLPRGAKEVHCIDKAGRAQGPALQLRGAYRFANRRLLKHRRFPRRDVLRMGQYVNGRRHGVWVQLNAKGQDLGSNRLESGTGTWKTWHNGGQAGAYGRLEGDVRTGSWRFWHHVGGKAGQGDYQAGKRNGSWQFWNSNGVLMRIVEYRAGQQHGLETNWHATGEKRNEGRYVDGRRDGRWLYWNSRGELLGANRVVRGDGRWTDWHDNGRKRREGDLVDLKPHGVWTRWHPNGRIAARGGYTRGVLNGGTWAYWNDGGEPSKRSRRSRLLGRLDALPGMLGGLRGKSRKRGKRGIGISGIRGGVAIGGIGSGVAGALRVSRATTISTKGGRTVTTRTTFGRPGGGTPVQLSVVYRTPPAVDLSGAGLPAVRSALVKCTTATIVKASQGKRARWTPKAHFAAFRLKVNQKPPQVARVIRAAKGLHGTWHTCAKAALELVQPRITGPGTSARVDVTVIVR